MKKEIIFGIAKFRDGKKRKAETLLILKHLADGQINNF